MNSTKLLLVFSAAALGAISAPPPLELSRGWKVVQDVHDAGEKLGMFQRDWTPFRIGPAVSDWEPVPRLAHLQLLFARQPYFGRELRYFNQAPWWYRLEFAAAPDVRGATLRFEGVDYFAKVWLNGKELGEHEGYADPFEFEVGAMLERERSNVLVVKVSSPWDTQIVDGRHERRFWTVIRQLIKGSYEHADTFIQRDVNPVGIWRPVRLIPHDGLRSSDEPAIETEVENDQAAVRFVWPVALEGAAREVELAIRFLSEPHGEEVAGAVRSYRLNPGETVLEAQAAIPRPKLWSTWDRGRPVLYHAEIRLRGSDGKPVLSREVAFGIRSIRLDRTAGKMSFLINGRPIYLRGTTYWPDLYLSNVDRARYERDMAAAVRAGFNAIRVHVHTENPEFYEICDRLGLVVLQDFDLNWHFPSDAAFAERAVKLLDRTIRKLRNHPSIICWVLMNEAAGEAKGPLTTVSPGPRLRAAAERIDPARPYILNSGARDDPWSGDGHDYHGSLQRGRYPEIIGSKERLATEFGADAPPTRLSALREPRIAQRLKEVLPRVAELHDYQYRLIKFYIEHYRIQKYAPNSGYFQFMWIDLSPQSFFGIHDYWGLPKNEGIGGGLRALEESNQPVGIFMEHTDRPVAWHAVNDLPADLGDAVAEWKAEGRGGKAASGSANVRLKPDSHLRIGGLSFPVDPAAVYRVTLVLRAADGRELARNVYRDPFHHRDRPEGYPDRVDHELGMRLWWAGGTAH